MPEFTLPSGRVLNLHDPLYGELIHVASEGADNIEELLYAKYALIVPEMSRDEIAKLNRKDGFALQAEMSRLWDGRPEEQEVPFETPSPQPSTEESPQTPKP